MIDKVEDSLLERFEDLTDSNSQMNNRVKLFTHVNRYFDNFLRVNKGLVVFDYFQYSALFILISLFYYNMISFSSISFMDNIKIMGEEIHIISMNILSIFLESWSARINLFLETLEIPNYIDLSFYPLQPLELGSNYDIPNDFIAIMVIFNILLMMYFLLRGYQFYSQKQLFNATVLNMYIPLIFLYNFKQRNSKKFIFIRLLRHQKNKSIMTNQAKTIVSNIFELDQDTLTQKDKIEIVLKPLKLFQLWDYYELSFTINDKNFKKEVEDKIEETINKVEDSNNTELENLNIDLLDELDID